MKLLPVVLLTICGFPWPTVLIHIETYDINLWLEQWIPFDGEPRMEENNSLGMKKLQAVFPKVMVLAGAPSNWHIYNPSLYDFRKKEISKDGFLDA